MPRNSLPERPHRYADWPPAPFWPTFIEKLLLAIIDGNLLAQGKEIDPDDADRRRRLDLAMEALLGISSPPGRRSTYDLPALLEVARLKHVADAVNDAAKFVGAPQDEAPSLRAASRSAAVLAAGNSVDAIVRRLYERVGKKADRDYLLQVTMHRYHEEEDDIVRDLRMIAEILERWNIDMKIDATRLGLGSLITPTPRK